MRLPHGLALTEAGDTLKYHCWYAFRELNEGVSSICGVRTRQTLRIAVARSYATSVLSHRTASFCDRYPWIELVLDGHRHLADLSRNEMDAAIRVGDGRWPDTNSAKIEDDPIFPVASPKLVGQFGSQEVAVPAEAMPLLHYPERPYWEMWTKGAGISLTRTKRGVFFSETL